MRLAITGGTGFVGATLVRLALVAGHAVHALTRRGGAPADRLTWVPGHLAAEESLAALIAGADAVIHVAGVVNAPDPAGFETGNVAGTAAMLAAARTAGVARFVQVSSLSAREPQLSAYGRSKQRAESLALASSLDVVLVRPPAIYGPGDRDMLELFRAARLGVVPLPPYGRTSVIEVSDLGRLLLALATAADVPTLVEPDDGRIDGWSHADLARAIGEAVGRRVLPLALPAPLMRLAARSDRLLRGDRAKLTADRVGYLCHPDWVVRERPSPDLWRPRVNTRAGLAATAAWYRTQGWL